MVLAGKLGLKRFTVFNIVQRNRFIGLTSLVPETHTNTNNEDPEEEPFEDEEDDKKEEEHLALADSFIVPIVDPILPAADTEALKADEPTHAPRSPIIIPLSQTCLQAPLGYRATRIMMRALLPSTSRKTDILKVDMPPRKRACLTTPALEFEIGESFAAGAARQPGPTKSDLRRCRVEQAGYGITDTWDEIVDTLMDIAPITLEGVNERVTELDTPVKQMTDEFEIRFKEAQDDRALLRARVNTLFRDRLDHRRTAMLMDREAMYAREAWAFSMDKSSAISAHVRTLETQNVMRTGAGMPMSFYGTKGVVGLTRWIEKMESVFQISNCIVACQNLKVKGIDLLNYNYRFQELALICDRMFTEESAKEVIEFATKMMDKKMLTHAERQAEHKRKFNYTSRNTQHHQQPFKRNNVARAYTVGPGDKKPYGGTKPLCPKCNYHHEGPCAPKCTNCKKIGHLARDCKGRPAATNNNNNKNNQRAQGANARGITCFECEVQGHYKRDCPKLKKNHNRKNQEKTVFQLTQEDLSNDLWAWRKYGQKPIKGSPFPRYGSIQFNSCPKSYKGEDQKPPGCPHEVPLLILTANRVIKMDDPAAVTDSSGVPSTIERSPLEFAHEAEISDQGTVALEMPPSRDVSATDAPGAGQAEEVAATDPPAATESRKRGRNGTDVNTPPKALRRDHADPQPTGTDIVQSSQGTIAAAYPDSENASSPVEIGSPESGNGVTAAPEVRTRGKAAEEVRSQVAHRDKRIQAQELEIKNLEALLEAEADMKKAPKDRSAGLSQELEYMRARFSDLQWYEDDRVEQRCARMDARLDALSIDFDEELYPHMLTAIAGRRWVIGHGLRLAVMKCGESLELRQAFADVAFAGIAKGMSEGLRHKVEHGQAQLSLESIEAYDPEAEAKYVAALQALKDLKYPLVDQLEGLNDTPKDVIMAALYLESDTRDDASQYIHDLRPSSSQLTIPVYPEVRDPRNPWAYKEEMLLADAIAANISRVEKKKKFRIVCRTHGVGFAYHARSDGVPVSVPTVVPQGLALLLADAATQTEFKEDT
nr:reverse transcriptase domain-containing protein [Tanacetum cinerariifolium]